MEEDEREGWQQYRAGQLDAAEHCFRRILDRDPEHAEALNGLGRVYLSWGHYAESEELFEMAARQAQMQLPRRRRRGEAQSGAVQLYVRSLYFLALSWIRQVQWDEAVHPLQEVLSWGPSAVEGPALYRLGQCYHHQGEYRAAIEAYGLALDDQILAEYSLGLAHWAVGQPAQADETWLKAVQRWPEVAPLVVHHPKVVPILAQVVGDIGFRRVAHYVDENMDLWHREARMRLGLAMQRLAPKMAPLP